MIKYSRIIEFVQKVMIVFIISFTFFYGVHVPYVPYSIVSICLCLYFIVSFKRKCRDIFTDAVVLLGSNSIAYVVAKLIRNGTLYIDMLNIALTVIYTCCIMYIISTLFYKKVSKDLKVLRLYPQREQDLERIKNYLNEFNVIGINGVWGSGKSIIVEHLKSDADIVCKFEFITIDLLSCNLDEAQAVILNELQKILNRNRVFSKHANQLKKILSGINFLEKFQGIFNADTALYKDTLLGLKNDICLFNKKIVIVYEDIDRISREDVIKKIFSISEQLSSDNIKVIYQYDQTNLEQIGFDSRFTEKYIPFVVNLTDISLSESFRFCLDDLKIDERVLSLEDFKHLFFPVHLNYHIQTKIKANHPFSLSSYNMGLRKPNHYIYELYNFLNDNESFQKDGKKKITITFFFIKHFLYDIYYQIEVGKSLLDTFQFVNGENSNSIKKIISDEKTTSESFGELLKHQSNRDKLVVLHWLEFNFDVNSVERSYEGFLNESQQNIDKRNKNERIDRTIWKLLANGKSGYTNYENAAKLLIKNVLNRPLENQQESFAKFRNDMYKNEGDNRTIFRIGLNSFISIFQAFCVTSVIATDWKKLIDFYFSNEKITQIDADLISVLNYCDIKDEAIYIWVLEKFNNLTIVGNLNSFAPYTSFIVKYSENLSRIGYINTSALDMIFDKGNIGDDVDIVCDVFRNLENDLQSLCNRIPLEEAKIKLNTVINFIKKNKELIKAKNRLDFIEPQITTSISSSFVNQDEYDKLNNLNCTHNEFETAVKTSYLNGRISIHEISMLYKDPKRKNATKQN